MSVNYDIHITYPPKDDTVDDRTTLADIRVDRRYLTAKMRVMPFLYKEWQLNGDETVKKVIAHEMSHILTQHMWDLHEQIYKNENEAEDAHEALTEGIGRLLYRLTRK